MIDIAKLNLVAPPGSPMRSVMDTLASARQAESAAPRVSAYRPPERIDRTDDLIAAALAGGIIAARGVTTVEEAVGVFREVREAVLTAHDLKR